MQLRSLALLFPVMIAACTTLLGDDFTLDEGAGGAGNAGATGGTTSSTMADGGGGATPDGCSNMVRDGNETDIDCGGSCPDKCAIGRGCMLDSDCVSDNCGDDSECVPPPPCGGQCAAWQTCEAEVCTPGAIFYVNLEGGSFTYGANDDASLNIQQVNSEALPDDMDPYGGTEFDKVAIFDPIAESFAPFNVEVTRTRPPDGVPYQMVVVTPSGSPLVPNQKIWAPPPDCGDMDDDNMAFVIFSAQSDAMEGVTPYAQAIVVAKTIGIMLGLEPVNGVTDIMHNMIAGGSTRTFEDFCHPQPTSQTWDCSAEHMPFCNDNPGLQSSHAELMALFGPRP